MGERTRIMVTVRLDCGCSVEKGLGSSHGFDDLEKTIKLAADILPHHFDRIEAAHQCDLVDDDNPNGERKAS